MLSDLWELKSDNCDESKQARTENLKVCFQKLHGDVTAYNLLFWVFILQSPFNFIEALAIILKHCFVRYEIIWNYFFHAYLLKSEFRHDVS